MFQISYSYTHAAFVIHEINFIKKTKKKNLFLKDNNLPIR